MDNLRQPFSMLVVIRKTINTTFINRKPLLVILCLVILTNMLLQVATGFDLEPILKYFPYLNAYGRRGKGINMRKHVSIVVISNYDISVAPCCLFLYFSIITISCSHESYAVNTLSIKDAFFKPFRNWKRPLLTSGCILLLTMGTYVVYIYISYAVSFLAGRSRYSSSRFYMAAPKWIFNAHVNALWMMSLVVTVLEDNISGFKAIIRARDLLKGKRTLTTLFMMLYYGSCLLARKYFDVFSLIFEEWAIEEMWALKLPFVIGFDVFLFVFYTVLYHECEMDNKVNGSSEPSDAVLDKSS